MAGVLPEVLAGFSRAIDEAEIGRLVGDLGGSVTALQEIAAEAARERMIPFAREPDPAPLARNLLRLRHDLVILRRAAAPPLPEAIARRLDPPLTRLAEDAGGFLRGAASALAQGRPAPPLMPVEASLNAFDSEVASLRREGLTRALSTPDLERLFALGFALEQLRLNLSDLALRVQEFAAAGSAGRRSFAALSL